MILDAWFWTGLVIGAVSFVVCVVMTAIRRHPADASILSVAAVELFTLVYAAAAAVRQLGGVDILVCNAAVNPYYGPLLDITDEAFDKIMTSNVKSNLWLCAKAIPPMAARGKGSVIIVSSIGGLRGSTVIGAYGISKAADFALCRSLAGEWGPKGVRVNCVCPGMIESRMLSTILQGRSGGNAPPPVEKIVDRIPARRLGLASEVASIVAFLASDEASYVSGSAYTVDGGRTAA